MSNIDKGIKAVMAKMPVPMIPYMEDSIRLDDDSPIRYAAFEEGTEAQRRLLAEEGWVKLPTKEETEEWISQTFGHLNPNVIQFFYMGIEALYTHLGGEKFITIR